MDVSACPRCGSLDVRPPTIQDGMWPGGAETQTMVCHDCAYRGMPLLFDGADAYRAFREEKETESGNTGTPEPTDRAGEAEADDEPRRPRQRAMPLFIGALALPIIALSLLSAVSNLTGSGAPSATRASAFFVALAGLAVGVALLRIAVRSWRGTPA